ncbi:unnamed protein product, partial [Sphagnum balticum]
MGGVAAPTRTQLDLSLEREGFTRGNFLYKFIMGRGKGCTGGLGCTLIFFLPFFLLFRGRG